MQFSLQKKSFTLIEMLIVIVIIGILAAALVPRLQAVQWRARDTKRKADLRQIANALEIYLLDNGSYPLAHATDYNVQAYRFSNATQPWIPGLTEILTSIPIDPINNNTYPYNTGWRLYSYGNVYNTDVWRYDLFTQLENENDPDRCEVQQRRHSIGNGGLWCPPAQAWRYTMYDISPIKNQ